METTELDTKSETVSANGHDGKWKTFDDDQAFLSHILAKKPAEELVDVPEWEVQVLCRALNAKDRVEIQMASYKEETKLIDYRPAFHLIVLAGAHNPATGRKIFTESHRDALLREQDGCAIERLALTILRLSGMLLGNAERARKN